MCSELGGAVSTIISDKVGRKGMATQKKEGVVLGI